MIRFGVIGYGYWGPNIVRNLHGLDSVKVSAICDKHHAAQKRALHAYPNMQVVADANEILRSANIDAVAIVTPVWTHFDLAKAALENGKHVFLEKPLTSNAAQAEELIELAEKKNLKIMVDHTFLFTGAVKKIRQLVDQGELGNLYYYDSMGEPRTFPARCQRGLGPCTARSFHHGLPDPGEARSRCRHRSGALERLEDIAFITVYFPENMIAHINVNWLSPVKVRTTLLGGEKKMLVWNDLEADEKVKIYDKGVEINNRRRRLRAAGQLSLRRHVGPQVEQIEALKLETQYFVRLHRQNKTPFNDGIAGLRVVQMLEAAGQIAEECGERLVQPMNEYLCIAPDVKLGQERQALEVHQSLRL